MIKIVYPDFLLSTENLVAGWPRTVIGLQFAKKVRVGQELAIYITDPIKKVVGIVKVTGDYIHRPESQWPYQTPVEWVVGPKEGLSLHNLGFDISPNKGDTGYVIGEVRVQKIKDRLASQPDMLLK
ncbi:hypothetical protein JJB07_09185 [Tumebacillus sp. ITR2]|uniref:EVE domain-containing protein n=1 Tax=Tumebacillus amylolyticus TaxID=2801339 RepID=A0ABS1J974_9BACL|nr:hypothetical protein [Tumebacillus amylolyticus]MBL0386826.1 hypothetical protein [Tumebacillus amylolyticus]